MVSMRISLMQIFLKRQLKNGVTEMQNLWLIDTEWTPMGTPRAHQSVFRRDDIFMTGRRCRCRR